MSTTETAVSEQPQAEAPAPAQPEKRPSKNDLKRQQIFQDRMKRHMGKGMNAQQAYLAIQKEDYERLPITEKMKRLEATMMGGLQSLAQELANLQHNDQVLADAMDANFRAITKIFVKLNVPQEEQAKLLIECDAEIKAERKAKAEARAAAAKKAQEVAEKKEVVAEVGKAGEPAPPPEGATEFGG